MMAVLPQEHHAVQLIDDQRQGRRIDHVEEEGEEEHHKDHRAKTCDRLHDACHDAAHGGDDPNHSSLPFPLGFTLL